MLASKQRDDRDAKIKDYLAEAAKCEAKADRAATPQLRVYWQELADRWHGVVVMLREGEP
ncbi:hypothetical protein GJW-30_1_03083 [Variibacter gotjawalensis]|uniref:Uncharacterized protein n=1 Tax=Variibacter gotjawalensis TaxID=1333996 RepID=A0A0S3PX85_9BRAD|nr:hypothetical protein [Variibacter gotjawalensis]NIK46367.1 hypothetical protein [Variibacter gotjawalensis]RZS48277.1 hypothetical protein EV661_0685 [Variibacter gotjawalensis]BAT60537.1 hypothetical protein GJW-30_1_03083 [Variibacter gotjawalensis]